MKKLFENWRGFEKEVLEEESYAEKQRRQRNFNTYNRRPGGLNNFQSFIDGEGAPEGAIRAAQRTFAEVPKGYTGNQPTGPKRIVKPGARVYKGGESPAQIAAGEYEGGVEDIAGKATGIAFGLIPLGLGTVFQALAGNVGMGSVATMLSSAPQAGTIMSPFVGTAARGLTAIPSSVGGVATVGLIAGTILGGAVLGREFADLGANLLGIKDPIAFRRIAYKYAQGALGMQGDLTGHQTARIETALKIINDDGNLPVNKRKFAGKGYGGARRHALVMLAISEHETGTPEHDKYKAELTAVLNRDAEIYKEGGGKGKQGEYYAKMMMHPRVQDNMDSLLDDVYSIAVGEGDADTKAVGRIGRLMAMDSTISDDKFHSLIGRERSEEEITLRDSEVTKNLTDQLTDPSLRGDTDVSDADALNNLIDFTLEAGDTDTANRAMSGEFTSSPSEGGTWEDQQARDAQADQTQADYDEDNAHLYGDEAGQSDTGPDEFGNYPTSEYEPPADDASELDSDYDPSEHFAMKEETKRKPKLSITKSRLAQIIKEELTSLKTEAFFDRFTGNAGLTDEEKRIKILTKYGKSIDGARGLKAEMVTLETGETGLQVTVPDNFFGVEKGETRFFETWQPVSQYIQWGDVGQRGCHVLAVYWGSVIIVGEK